MRKKSEEMTPIELARHQVLAARRAALRALAYVTYDKDSDSLSPGGRADVECIVAWARAVLDTTRPAWVNKASLDDLTQLIRHFSGRQN